MKRELNLSVTTHGRVLIDDAARDTLRLLAGFHGYAQNAEEMMEMLAGIPVDAPWTRVAVQGLHRFYRGRGEVTVASWMTRQDRDALIADNVRYVDAAIAAAAEARTIERLVLFGFSQGTAMAFRAAVLGSRRPEAVIAAGGDVPPELLKGDAPRAWGAAGGVAALRVLLVRGEQDTYYTEPKMRADKASLAAAGARVETFTFDGGHEWTPECGARAAEFIDTPGG